jgi:hypothetical protein
MTTQVISKRTGTVRNIETGGTHCARRVFTPGVTPPMQGHHLVRRRVRRDTKPVIPASAPDGRGGYAATWLSVWDDRSPCFNSPQTDGGQKLAELQAYRETVREQLPEHRALFAGIESFGEGFLATANWLSSLKPLDRLLAEMVTVTASGDVLRNTGIDRDSRPYHRRPLTIARLWGAQEKEIDQIIADLAAMDSTPETAAFFQANPETLKSLAAEMRALEPQEDIMDNATRVADPEAEPEAEPEQSGFSQFVSLDQKAPAFDWIERHTIRYRKLLADMERCKETPKLREMIPALLELKGADATIAWHWYNEAKRRIFRNKFGNPSQKALKWERRLKMAGVNLAEAAKAVTALKGADKAYLIPVLNKAFWAKNHPPPNKANAATK